MPGAPADRNLVDLYADAGIEFIGLSDKRPDALHVRKLLLNRRRSLVVLAPRVFKSRRGFLHGSFSSRASRY